MDVSLRDAARRKLEADKAQLRRDLETANRDLAMALAAGQSADAPTKRVADVLEGLASIDRQLALLKRTEPRPEEV